MIYKPINLGQGFSDAPVPQYIVDALTTTLNNPNYLLHQYTRGFVSNLLLLVLTKCTDMCKQEQQTLMTA